MQKKIKNPEEFEKLVTDITAVIVVFAVPGLVIWGVVYVVYNSIKGLF